MADSNADMNHPILNLTPEEKRAYSYLFNQADTDQLGVVTGERAVAFFERTSVSASVLGEIWQIADNENRGLLTKPGFCMVLRLIGHYQAGREPTAELAFKPAPIPSFNGLQIPGLVAPTSPKIASHTSNLQPQLTSQNGPVRVPPLDPQKVQQYSGLFERSGAQGGILDGATAKSIFERAGLPNDVLGRIWGLSDRQQRGALDQTEFIVAMHLLTSFKTRAMTAVPTTLPQALYEAAARQGVPPPPAARQPQTSDSRQFSGQIGAAQTRIQTSLARAPRVANPPFQTPSSTGEIPWLVSSQEKIKYDQYFASIDSLGQGILTGEQAVRFFSDSGLPEETLAQIWDLSDINSEGQLNRDEFAVAMYLIRQQRGPNPVGLPSSLPQALIPPSMRQPGQQQQQQATPTTFTGVASASTVPKSAADDLFGLDTPASPVRTQQSQLPLQAQTTGLSSAGDPFSNSPIASPGSPQRFPPQAQATNTVFKPFMPTSAFGASLAQQNTGGSASSTQGQSRAAPVPSGLQQTFGNDDLLGDDETNKMENSKITSETTELANMSSQIGNLRSQMENTQTKKALTQQEVSTTSAQKRDLEMRLQQFRTQYEQEVRTVKELEHQLLSTKESTKKLAQDLAMIEGTHQDLQSQHTSLAEQLQVDQQENLSLKQRITQINNTITQLKPAIEKLKLDARQQRGLVSINKKQLSTVEAEQERLQQEKSELEREALEHATPSGPQTNSAEMKVTEKLMATTTPTGSTLTSKNPFFRGSNFDSLSEKAASPGSTANAPNPSAFDAIFGPSSGFAPSGTVNSRSGTPPATSFVGRSIAPIGQGATLSDSVRSLSSVEETILSATPSPSTSSATQGLEPLPVKHEQLSFASTPSSVVEVADRQDKAATSREVLPVASRTEDRSLQLEPEGSPATDDIPQTLPGAFPSEKQEDFDKAVAGSQKSDLTKAEAGIAEIPNRSGREAVKPPEFPPIQNLEPEDDDSDDSEDGYSASPEHKVVAMPPSISTQASPPPYQRAHDEAVAPKRSGSIDFPPEFGGLLPAREDETTLPTSTESPESHVLETNKASSQPTTQISTASSTSAIPVSSAVLPPSRNAFNELDDFADFGDLAEAKEADRSAADPNFGFGPRQVDEFNPAFDSPTLSVSTTILSQSTPTIPKGSTGSTFGDSHGYNGVSSGASNAFKPSIITGFGSSGVDQAASDSNHDWDAIFSGLDSSKTGDASLNGVDDPWNTGRSAATPSGIDTTNPGTSASTAKVSGGALTPGTEHDDPILKRLTNLGYPRADALQALEKFDYDINKAADHLLRPNVGTITKT